MCAAIVNNFHPDHEDVKSPTTPDMPEGAHLFAPESSDLTNGDSQLLNELSAKVWKTMTFGWSVLFFSL